MLHLFWSLDDSRAQRFQRLALSIGGLVGERLCSHYVTLLCMEFTLPRYCLECMKKGANRIYKKKKKKKQKKI